MQHKTYSVAIEISGPTAMCTRPDTGQPDWPPRHNTQVDALLTRLIVAGDIAALLNCD